MFAKKPLIKKKRAAIKGCFFREWEVLQPRVKTIRGFLCCESLGSMLSAINQGKGVVKRIESYTHFYNIRLYIIYILYIALYL